MDEEIISVKWLCKFQRFKTTSGYGLRFMPESLCSLIQLHSHYQY
jgi:hypothetical protein